MQEHINYVGINVLNQGERARMKSIISKEYEKMNNLVAPESLKLKVHVKTYDKEGKRKRYVLHMKAETPYGRINLDGSEADLRKHAHWDIAKATHKAMKFMDKQVKRNVNPDGHKWRHKFLRLGRK